uniref:PPM-type phosphatase domain-containing protein n=1 Tax=Compsopogon caeruleus TaxID=31354 RepID=A0A7S1T9I4_9RHOD
MYGVFDGHGGKFVADFAAATFVERLEAEEDFTERRDLTRAFRNVCLGLDQEILQQSRELRSYAGSTVSFVVVDEDSIACCNLGDSRAVLARNGQAIPLSRDHSIFEKDELERLRKAGAWITSSGVNGRLAMTRALGDLDMKDHLPNTFPGKVFHGPVIIAEPEVRVLSITTEDQFIIVACDGFWGKVDNNQAVQLGALYLDKLSSPEQAARELARAAQELGSTDNITVTLIVLRGPKLEEKRSDSLHNGTNILSRLRKGAGAGRTGSSTHGSRSALTSLNADDGTPQPANESPNGIEDLSRLQKSLHGATNALRVLRMGGRSIISDTYDPGSGNETPVFSSNSDLQILEQKELSQSPSPSESPDIGRRRVNDERLSPFSSPFSSMRHRSFASRSDQQIRAKAESSEQPELQTTERGSLSPRMRDQINDPKRRFRRKERESQSVHGGWNRGADSPSKLEGTAAQEPQFGLGQARGISRLFFRSTSHWELTSPAIAGEAGGGSTQIDE